MQVFLMCIQPFGNKPQRSLLIGGQVAYAYAYAIFFPSFPGSVGVTSSSYSLNSSWRQSNITGMSSLFVLFIQATKPLFFYHIRFLRNPAILRSFLCKQFRVQNNMPGVPFFTKLIPFPVALFGNNLGMAGQIANDIKSEPNTYARY